MRFFPFNIYHIYNEGNNKQPIFLNRQDYIIFLNLYERLFPPNCSTLAWCLSPNRFDLMIYSGENCGIRIRQGGIYIDGITNNIRKLLSNYARIFNHNYKRSGSLFRQKTKSKCLSLTEIKDPNFHSSKDFINCFNYIHQIPILSKFETDLSNWEFSSFLDYANQRNGGICQKELASLLCGYDPGNFQNKVY